MIGQIWGNLWPRVLLFSAIAWVSILMPIGDLGAEIQGFIHRMSEPGAMLLLIATSLVFGVPELIIWITGLDQRSRVTKASYLICGKLALTGAELCRGSLTIVWVIIANVALFLVITGESAAIPQNRLILLAVYVILSVIAGAYAIWLEQRLNRRRHTQEPTVHKAERRHIKKRQSAGTVPT